MVFVLLSWKMSLSFEGQASHVSLAFHSQQVTGGSAEAPIIVIPGSFFLLTHQLGPTALLFQV